MFHGFIKSINIKLTILINKNHHFSDDNQLLSWSVSTNQPTKVAQLDKDIFATDMQFLSKQGTSLGKHGDLILVTSADGRFHIINRSGRIERTVEAHKGAILVGQWGNDGSGFLTGELHQKNCYNRDCTCGFRG